MLECRHAVLDDLGVEGAGRVAGRSGVWMRGTDKIAAIGIRLKSPGAPVMFSQMRAGRYCLPRAPGLGVEFKEASLREFAFPDGPVWQRRSAR